MGRQFYARICGGRKEEIVIINKLLSIIKTNLKEKS